MRRRWIVGVLALLVLGGSVAVAAVLGTQAGGVHFGYSAAERQAGEAAATSTPQDNDDSDEADDKGAGSGPPPWAHSHKAAGKGHGEHAWKESWRKLTPAQRERKMKTLAKAHAEGMREWKDCVAAAGDDKAQRADCEKPLPPGLAKKQQ